MKESDRPPVDSFHELTAGGFAGRDVAAVVFDMDGVLIDSGAHHRDAWRALLEELGLTPPDEFWRLTIGRPAEEAVPLLLGRACSRDEAWRLASRKRDHYARLARRGVVPVAGAREFVATLGRANVPCAVATSASRHDAGRMLAAVGIAGDFRAIVTAEDVRAGKPDPEVYVLAARALRTPAARCLVFEDSLVGVQAACAAGMPVAGVTTAYTAAELRAAGAVAAIASFQGLGWPP